MFSAVVAGLAMGGLLVGYFVICIWADSKIMEMIDKARDEMSRRIEDGRS